MLFRVRQSTKQGKDVYARPTPVAVEMLIQRLGGIPDFAFPREETQDVAATEAPQLVDSLDQPVQRVRHVGGDLAAVRVGIASLQRAVQDLDRVGSARDLDDWRGCAVGAGEVLREAFGVDRRGGDDQLQIRALWQQVFQVPQQEVDVQAAFVRLIDDDRVVFAE